MRAKTAMNLVIIFLILNTTYALLYDLLVITEKIRLEIIQGHTILLVFLGVVSACILIKNKYWILAFIFTGCRTIAQLLASRYFVSANDVSKLTFSSIVLIAIGMICLILALSFFYKLLKVKDFPSKKYVYKWMSDADTYLKRKFNLRQ